MEDNKCENTMCEGKGDKVIHLILTDDFENEDCYWCENCLERDRDMVETIIED